MTRDLQHLVSRSEPGLTRGCVGNLRARPSLELTNKSASTGDSEDGTVGL